MEILVEFILEIIGEFVTEIIKNKNISLGIRIPVLILFSIMILGIIILLGYLGIKVIKESIIGIILLIFSLIFLGAYIVFMYKFFKN